MGRGGTRPSSSPGETGRRPSSPCHRAEGRTVTGKRSLIVTADDFGIGPATSLGILDLAVQGLVTGTVLLVNSPYAEQAVRAWNQAGRPVELGWHPALTL